MYPIIRMTKEFWKFRNAPKLGTFDTHVSHHICWPWDLDMWMELNNGRALTLYDLGRLVLAKRTGFIGTAKDNGWMMTVAGSSIRYRKRVRMFDRLKMTSRFVGWDEKFLYLEHAMWNGETCTSHVLIRMAVTDQDGLVRTDKVVAAHGHDGPVPRLPGWISAWSQAEAQRPWPPMQEDVAETQLPAA